MELSDYLSVLRARWVLVVGCALIATLVVGALSLRAPRLYQARSSVFFSVGVRQSPGELARGFSYAQGLVTSYAQMAEQPLVLSPVIAQLGLDTTPAVLARSVAAENPRDTVILDIIVTDTSPQRSADIANAIARQLSVVVGQLVPRGSSTAAPVRVTVVAPAPVPRTPVSPRLVVNLTLAFLAATFAGVVLAFVRDVLDARITGLRDVARITDTPVIGTVTAPAVRSSHPAWRGSLRVPWRGALGGPWFGSWGGRPGSSQESARELRTNFQHLCATRGVSCVVFTSAVRDAATADAVATLGLQMTQIGVSTLLVDGDLRMPTLSRSWGYDGAVGFSSALQGTTDALEAVQQCGDTRLHILPAGPVVADPNLLLDSDAVGAVIDQLVRVYELVLVKSPPVLRVADGLLLSRFADGIVMVADEPNMKREALAEEVRALALTTTPVLGIVLAR